MDKTEDFILKPRSIYDFKPQEKLVYDTIIIGTGIAGFSAAMYAARLGLKVLVIGEMNGGKITLTESVENYPGFVSINGLKLAELIENHARDYDIDILTDIVEKIFKKKNNLYAVSTAKKMFTGKTLIIATGTIEKKLNIPGEKEFTGNGVSYCAICDATMTKNKIVAVVGGGDSAVKEANLLAKYAKQVYIINNEPKLHAESRHINSLEDNVHKNKIKVFNSANINSINGKSSVENITLVKNKQTKKLPVDWVFIYIGQMPKIIGKEIGIKTNNKNEIMIDVNCETNIKGVYAAGDVTSTSWKQAIIAAAQGVTAAFNAYNYLTKKE
jgi:thioredoxin reductase (NADPH)